MRVLVLGGAGFIGSHLVRRLAGAGYEVGVFDLSNPAEVDANRMAALRLRSRWLATAAVFQGSVADRHLLAGTIRTFAPDCIVYLAALALVPQVACKPAEAVESMSAGLTNCLEIIRGSLVQRFIYVSSSMVYGHFGSDPLPEEATTAPVNLYGGLKLAGEMLTRAYLARTSQEAVIIRPSSAYGPTDVHGRVVQKCCEAALMGEPFYVTDPEDTFLDFTWVEDLVEGIMLAVTTPAAAGETFNLTFGRARSLGELVDLVARRSGGISVVRRHGEPVERPRRGTLDISKARRLLGYAPRTDLEQGVELYLHLLGSAQRPVIGRAVA